MITTWILCAVLNTGVQCLPFHSQAGCTVARLSLETDVIHLAECAPVKVNIAPAQYPLPRPRPERKAKQ